VRKRIKSLEGNDFQNQAELEIPETPAKKSFQIVIGAERIVDPMLAQYAAKVVLHNEVDPLLTKAILAEEVKAAGLARAYSSINRVADSRSRATRKHMGSPPHPTSLEASLDSKQERRVVEPERAANTWHDDEITGHNPDDPDDDGTGINGIGFKPTPAMAYARTEKRRAQMADYKSREAREARAKRNEKRRGNELSQASQIEQETARRVRFLVDGTI